MAGIPRRGVWIVRYVLRAGPGMGGPSAAARELPEAVWKKLPAHLRAAYAPAQNDAPQAKWAVLPGIGGVPASSVAAMKEADRLLREWVTFMAARGKL